MTTRTPSPAEVLRDRLADYVFWPMTVWFVIGGVVYQAMDGLSWWVTSPILAVAVLTQKAVAFYVADRFLRKTKAEEK